MLANALEQANWQGPVPSQENWRSMVYERLKLLDWKAALANVRPFLERPEERDLLSIDNFARLLNQTED